MDTNQIAVKSALDAWTARLASANKMFDELSDDDLRRQVAPGRNRGVYLMGHLAVVHDKMLPLLSLGDQLHPELESVFLHTPDKEGPTPSVAEVRAIWKKVHSTLNAKLESLSTADWFAKHTAVSEEDFKNEPHRNRMNVVIGRTNHMQYHMGQVALLKN